APLARLESRIALQTLFTRFPKLTLAVPSTAIEYALQISTVGPERLPVRLNPGS
ncbi:MAG: cytochrome P450, partial [Nocardia sp.]|nr:cytochrome P450 [Nocardia sp.]